MPADQSDSNPLAGSAWCQQFRVVERLSAGAYGFVWLCLEVATGDKVAIKFISRERNKIDKNVEREIINHSMLEHPHIIQFKLCFLTDKYLAIAMEYAGGKDLLRLVNDNHGLAEDDARWLFQQLMLAVDYMHRCNSKDCLQQSQSQQIAKFDTRRMGVVNRDIKLENILLKTPDKHPILKMCDFGYSINENHSLPKTALGTPGYTAPEVLRNVRQNKCYEGRPADVWSSGVVLYSMLFCRYPFDERQGDPPNDRWHAQQRQQLFIERIQAGDVVIPADWQVSPECEDLIRRIFTPCPLQRITISQILQHPWFLVNLPPELIKGDWNRQVLQDIKFEQRAEQIRVTVRHALKAVVKSPPSPQWPSQCVSDSPGECSDMSDLSASEGANY